MVPRSTATKLDMARLIWTGDARTVRSLEADRKCKSFSAMFTDVYRPSWRMMSILHGENTGSLTVFSRNAGREKSRARHFFQDKKQIHAIVFSKREYDMF